jgi:hypothetical protein
MKELDSGEPLLQMKAFDDSPHGLLPDFQFFSRDERPLFQRGI